VDDVISGVGFRPFLAQIAWPYAPTVRGNFLTNVFIGNKAIIRVFRVLDWLSIVSGSNVMT